MRSTLTTIVIVTFKGIIIKKTLKSLSKKFQVIIVENSNNKKFKKKIETQFYNTSVILTGSNLGFGKANNIGLKKVKTKFSLILNPDIETDYKKILELEKIAKTTKNFGILTCNCNGLFETINSYKDKFEKEDLNKLRYSHSKHSYLKPITFVPGWCMMFNTKDLKRVNYFDENYFLYFEDKDISRSIKNIGKDLLVVENIKIKHQFGTSSFSKKNQIFNHSWHVRFWHFYWSSFYYYRKHYGLIKSIRKHFSKFLRFNYLFLFYKFSNNKDLSLLNKFKANGILSQFKNQKATAEPKI